MLGGGMLGGGMLGGGMLGGGMLGGGMPMAPAGMPPGGGARGGGIFGGGIFGGGIFGGGIPPSGGILGGGMLGGGMFGGGIDGGGMFGGAPGSAPGRGGGDMPADTPTPREGEWYDSGAPIGGPPMSGAPPMSSAPRGGAMTPGGGIALIDDGPSPSREAHSLLWVGAYESAGGAGGAAGGVSSRSSKLTSGAGGAAGAADALPSAARASLRPSKLKPDPAPSLAAATRVGGASGALLANAVLTCPGTLAVDCSWPWARSPCLARATLAKRSAELNARTSPAPSAGVWFVAAAGCAGTGRGVRPLCAEEKEARISALENDLT